MRQQIEIQIEQLTRNFITVSVIRYTLGYVSKASEICPSRSTWLKIHTSRRLNLRLMNAVLILRQNI